MRRIVPKRYPVHREEVGLNFEFPKEKCGRALHDVSEKKDVNYDWPKSSKSYVIEIKMVS